MAGKVGIATIREATREDNAALIDLEWLCSQHFYDETTSFDRRPDFFAKPDLQGDAKVWVAEDEGKLVGIHAGAFHTVLVDGAKVRAVYLYGMRVHPDYRRNGLALELMSAANEASLKDGAQLWYLYVRKGNDPSIGLSNKYGMQRLGEVSYLSIETPGLESLTCSCVRKASPDEVERIVHLINKTHSKLDLYIPHSIDYLNKRLSRTADYSWDDFYVFEAGAEILACAGIWDKAASERTYIHHAVTGQSKILFPEMVLDWGFEEGHEDAMGNLLQHLAGEAARAGRNRLQVALEPFPQSYQYLQSFLIHNVRWYLNWKPLGHWEGSLRLPAFFDLAYL